jgi:hypothetical protein
MKAAAIMILSTSGLHVFPKSCHHVATPGYSAVEIVGDAGNDEQEQPGACKRNASVMKRSDEKDVTKKPRR